MITPNTGLHLLVAESEGPDHRAAREKRAGRSNGESFEACLRHLAPGARVSRTRPVDGDDAGNLGGFDAVFLTGAPLHLYQDTAGNGRLVAFMRAVFRSGTPAFGSCAGLQVATVAAGGRVRRSARTEAGFARSIARTPAGAAHPLLDGRPPVFDAPSIHSDEVEQLPAGAACLAGNSASRVQAAEIRLGPGVFWGVQYHPELPLDEIGSALRDEDEALAADIQAIGRDPANGALRRQLRLDDEVLDPARRTTELRNFLRELVLPVRGARGRG